MRQLVVPASKMKHRCNVCLIALEYARTASERKWTKVHSGSFWLAKMKTASIFNEDWPKRSLLLTTLEAGSACPLSRRSPLSCWRPQHHVTLSPMLGHGAPRTSYTTWVKWAQCPNRGLSSWPRSPHTCLEVNVSIRVMEVLHDPVWEKCVQFRVWKTNTDTCFATVIWWITHWMMCQTWLRVINRIITHKFGSSLIFHMSAISFLLSKRWQLFI